MELTQRLEINTHHVLTVEPPTYFVSVLQRSDCEPGYVKIVLEATSTTNCEQLKRRCTCEESETFANDIAVEPWPWCADGHASVASHPRLWLGWISPNAQVNKLWDCAWTSVQKRAQKFVSGKSRPAAEYFGAVTQVSVFLHVRELICSMMFKPAWRLSRIETMIQTHFFSR